MRTIFFMFAAAALMAMPAALTHAQDTSAEVEAEATVETEVETRPGSLLPKIGPAVRDAVDATRTNVRNAASTTRNVVQDRVDDIRGLVTERQEAQRAEVAEKRAAMQERAEEAKAEARARFGENVERLVANIVEKLGAAAEHLISIANRIETRISELEQDGHDMSNSLDLLADARAAIVVAQDDVAEVSVALEAALGSETPKEQLAAVRTAVTEARESLRAARAALKEVLESIRIEVSASAEVEASVE